MNNKKSKIVLALSFCFSVPLELSSIRFHNLIDRDVFFGSWVRIIFFLPNIFFNSLARVLERVVLPLVSPPSRVINIPAGNFSEY